MENKEYRLGSIVIMKKQHPCGTNEWEIVRLGADIKIKCLNCGRTVLLPRIEFNKKLKKIYIIDSRKTKEEMVCDLKKSNIIFLLGGDTLKQINFINKYDLKDHINRDDAIIMGISAGAINLAKKVILAKDEQDNIPELSIYDGIGVTDINIEPHCDFNNKKHWKELKEASLYSKIVVMHDDCFIIIEDDKCNYYGSYLILNKKEITYKNNKTTLQEFIKDINYEKQE